MVVMGWWRRGSGYRFTRFGTFTLGVIGSSTTISTGSHASMGARYCLPVMCGQSDGCGVGVVGVQHTSKKLRVLRLAVLLPYI